MEAVAAPAVAAGPSFGQVVVPTMYYLMVMILPAVGNLVDSSQLKVLITFMILPMAVLLMARDPKFKINRNLAMGATLAAYFIIASIAGLSKDFKKTIEDPKNSTKLKAVLIWFGVMMIYAMLIIVPVMAGMSPLYESANMA
jgi:hypothetical protein